MNTNVLAIAAMMILLSVGVGIGWGFQTTVGSSSAVTVTSTATTGSSQAQEPYSLTLVVTTGNTFNSTVGDQPAFYVLTPAGLRSSANIALPAGRLIKLTIVDYDDGNASLTDPQYANVQGTINGTITYVSNDNVNSSQGSSGITITGGQTVAKVDPSDIAHTFTIPTLGINIPIPLSSTVTAYFKIEQAGTYTWICETTCGSGTTGLEGAMSTQGWMTGSIEATEAIAGPTTQASGTASANGPYQLTLVEVMSNFWNSTSPLQPKVFVVGPDGLESSADIVVPANRLIQLTIVSYDAPTPNSTLAMATVTGTVGGNVYLVNGTLGSGMTNDSMTRMTQWGENVTSVPVSSLTGTITVPQLNINIPFSSMSTTIAYVEFNQRGTYTWVCLPPCGLGKDGLAGAMSTPGWMMGNIVVS